jgi:hypothetical protein
MIRLSPIRIQSKWWQEEKAFGVSTVDDGPLDRDRQPDKLRK